VCQNGVIIPLIEIHTILSVVVEEIGRVQPVFNSQISTHEFGGITSRARQEKSGAFYWSPASHATNEDD
jgi:hypothetical protein